MSRRTYDSTRRRQQAAATRAAVLDAGRRLFVERGYVGATVGDIATSAGVAPATVNAAFGGKAGLLKALVDVAIAGDDDPIPVSERVIAQQVSAEPEPRRQLALLAGFITDVHGRLADLTDVMQQAAGADDQVRAQLARGQAQRRTGMGEFVSHLDPGALSLDAESAADIVWALTDPRLYLGLVRERGWSPDRYRQWLAGQLTAALLGSADG